MILLKNRFTYKSIFQKSKLPSQSHVIRTYKVLAIESSCDDSCIALLERTKPNQTPTIIDHTKKTLNSAAVGGIMPTAAYTYHMSTIANMCIEFCSKHNLSAQTPPDLICVTRGPGMAGSLSSSTEFAKGLSVAWNVPLIGVHHMLGHLLTSFLPTKESEQKQPPNYPFLSLLCSGGHTMLVLSKSVSEHEIIINVSDIAVGDSLDKCARELGLYGNMLGRELEKFINDIPIEEIEEFKILPIDTRLSNKYNFKLTLPYQNPKNGKFQDDIIQFAFAQFLSNIQSYKKKFINSNIIEDEKIKRMIAYKTQEYIFDHIIDRINLAFKRHGLNRSKSDGKFIGVKDFVCSGGVAANSRLREKLFNNLNYNEIGSNPLNFHFPDLSLCTDNAVMIGYAGMEIFEKLKLKTNLNFIPIRKWPLNKLLSVESWVQVNDDEINRVCKYNL
ncbi:QRI7 [Candida pseudojiufengensis]|uniref:QRI7 n=1 Tax=Candida pseudojiufengensis TaxID=497109 RepID=UPI00222453CD|nr:QRI7 [Candida pseudojiufengensis]KAI5965566.1 QRI7 [Candida pseudojiufengensis]